MDSLNLKILFKKKEDRNDGDEKFAVILRTALTCHVIIVFWFCDFTHNGRAVAI